MGVKAGCEAILHSVTRTLEDPNIQPKERWTLLLDFSNAFNSISRGRMFEEVRAHIPSIAAWMESCYGAQPILHLGEHTILSQGGVQHGGDPLHLLQHCGLAKRGGTNFGDHSRWKPSEVVRMSDGRWLQELSPSLGMKRRDFVEVEPPSWTVFLHDLESLE